MYMKLVDHVIAEVGVSHIWAVAELGSLVRISHKTTIGEMGVSEMGMNLRNITAVFMLRLQ